MNGSFIVTDTSLQFNEKIMLTKMACPGYNEKEFIESLLRTTRYKFDNGLLILMQDMTELSKWSRKIEKQPRTNKT
jgi:heat shock protein HslJ